MKTYARLALACGEPRMGKFLRSVTAQDLAFWQAFEEADGPIGYGPLVRLAAWLGWTQFDSKKLGGPENLIAWLEAFVANPAADDEADGEDEPLTAEEIEQRRDAITGKLMRMFGHPEAKNNGNRQSQSHPGP